VMYVVIYPVACMAVLCWVAKGMFGRYVIERLGVL
jgi:fluoroquinolone transport system permease protein